MNKKNNGMGNLSKAGNNIKEKLKLSFAPQPQKKTINQNKKVNKYIKPEKHTYGNADFKKVSINTEINKHQFMSKENIDTQIGNRYKKITPRAANTVKSKATFCLDSIAKEQLTKIYIKRLKSHQKSDRSSLICEAISLLFEKER